MANPQEQAWQRQHDKGVLDSKRQQKDQEKYAAKQKAQLKAAALPQQKEMARYEAGKKGEMGKYEKDVKQRAGISGAEGDKMKARDLSSVRKQAMDLKKKIKAGDIKGVAKEAAFEAMQQLTARGLNAAWTNVYYIAPFLYIVFHWFCRYSHVNEDLRNMFCPFGSEWTGGGKVTKAAGAAGGMAGKAIEIVELIVFFICCLILAAAIFISMLPYIIIGYMIYQISELTLSWDSVKVLWSGLGDLWTLLGGKGFIVTGIKAVGKAILGALLGYN